MEELGLGLVSQKTPPTQKIESSSDTLMKEQPMEVVESKYDPS